MADFDPTPPTRELQFPLYVKAPLILLGLALVVFTPLKMYIPGYGNASNAKELRTLKFRTDSLEQSMRYKDQYIENIKNVLQGKVMVNLDTIPLNIPVPEKIND